jgi:hypothetical protein
VGGLESDVVAGSELVVDGEGAGFDVEDFQEVEAVLVVLGIFAGA